MKLKLMAAMTAAALGTLAFADNADAMNVHVNGTQVILSGDVKYSDLYVLADTIDRLRQQGRSIDTLVMRNSNGGSVYAGYNIGDFARRNGLTTVVSGYCISACSMMFVGGQERAFAAGDQPLSTQYIGIHGMTGGNDKYLDSSRPTAFYQYFVQAIANGDLSKTDAQLLDDAFSDHGNAYARLFDPAANLSPSVYWCHSNCNLPAQYKAYPNDDVYNLGFINHRVPVATTDTLVVNKDVTGNVNPNYYNAYAPGARPYVNDDLTNVEAGRNFLTILLGTNVSPLLTPSAEPDDVEVGYWNALTPAQRKVAIANLFGQLYAIYPNLKTNLDGWLKVFNANIDKDFVDRSVLSVNDAYGIIKVTNGATWTLAGNDHGAADALYMDNGRLHLAGGTINIVDNYLYNGSILSGTGTLGAHTQWAKVYVNSGSIVHPTGDGLDVTGNVRLNAGSTLAIDVSPILADGLAPLRFGLLDEGSDTLFGALSVLSGSARLALNVAPGFYQPGRSYALVGYSPGSAALLQDAIAAKKAPADLDIVINGFRHLVRADAQGNPVADYDIDPTTGTAFHPTDGSLLSYQLVQQPTGIVLQANDPFRDPSLCSRDGCGLGTALSAAAQRPASGLEPLLGALEFANAAQASHAAGQIRGEGYAALRTASLGLLGDFSGTLDQHVRAVSPGSDDGATAAFMNGAAGMGLDGTRRGTDVTSMMRYLVAPDEVAGGSSTGHTNVWGRLFGSKGRLDAQGDAAGLRERTTGVMLGVDVPLKDNVVIGGSLGYGKLRANDSGSVFQGRVRALDARFYADYRYDGGYLDASLGVTRLRQTANRGIDLPLYAARGSSRDAGNAWSLHLEHGLTLRDRHDIVWQPILPSLDMVRLPENRFSDKGLGAAGLDVRAKSTTDTRLGVGVQVYKVFAWGDQGTWTPHARVLLQHRFNRHENEFMANLQGYPEGVFQVTGPNEGLNHAVVNAGLSARRGQHVAFTVDYVGDYAKRHRDQGVMLGASYRW